MDAGRLACELPLGCRGAQAWWSVWRSGEQLSVVLRVLLELGVWVLSIALAGALVGCVTTRDTLRERARNELPCHEPLVVQRLGAGGYRVSGCGRAITYTCITHEGLTTCAPSMRESSERPAAPVAPPSTWSNGQVERLRFAVRGGVLACLPPELTEVELEVTISVAGRVRRVGRVPGDDSVSECIDGVLAGQELDGDVELARTVALRIRRGG